MGQESSKLFKRQACNLEYRFDEHVKTNRLILRISTFNSTPLKNSPIPRHCVIRKSSQSTQHCVI